LLACQ
jgi:hypothetical protein